MTTPAIFKETEDEANALEERGTGPSEEKMEEPTLDELGETLGGSKNLPIYKKKRDILKKLEQNRVLVISGDTGCGKTTQVPQFILDDCLLKRQDCRIICTQPRRLAAVSIAKRIAQERRERVGDSVGYHVGMQSKVYPSTKVIFMTTGIFLQRLVNNPDQMKKVTHIILDEVHERDLDIDFCLVVLKHLLNKKELPFKLVLMSATFNVELFCNYFSLKSIKEIENMEVYVGAAEQLKKDEEEALAKSGWGPALPSDWDKPLEKEVSQEDEFIEEKPN